MSSVAHTSRTSALTGPRHFYFCHGGLELSTELSREQLVPSVYVCYTSSEELKKSQAEVE